MKILTPREVHAKKVAELGLDAKSLDLLTIEAIATALRRAAAFYSPCPASTLVRQVVRPLEGLVEHLDEAKVIVEDTLEALIAHGDLLEQREIGREHEDASRVLLYPAPPSFVARESGSAILLGIPFDSLLHLPEELQRRVEHVKHVRRLQATTGEDLAAELRQSGYLELSQARWFRAPPVTAPAQQVAGMDRDLETMPTAIDIPGLTVLDPATPVRFYRGRWKEPKGLTGRFVGRRSQAYGADLWCYVELREGRPQRFLDLPRFYVRDCHARGCDEGWYLQLAIDACRKVPQRFRIRRGKKGHSIAQFFSPLPMWTRRRWEAVGEPAETDGCLFAYQFKDAEIPQEVRHMREALWLDELSDAGG